MVIGLKMIDQTVVEATRRQRLLEEKPRLAGIVAPLPGFDRFVFFRGTEQDCRRLFQQMAEGPFVCAELSLEGAGVQERFDRLVDFAMLAEADKEWFALTKQGKDMYTDGLVPAVFHFPTQG